MKIVFSSQAWEDYKLDKDAIVIAQARYHY